jgi:hypothetical protein
MFGEGLQWKKMTCRNGNIKTKKSDKGRITPAAVQLRYIKYL